MPSHDNMPTDSDSLAPTPQLQELLKAFDPGRHGGEAMNGDSVGKEFPASESTDGAGSSPEGGSAHPGRWR